MHHEKLLEAWLAGYGGATLIAYRPVAQSFLTQVPLEMPAIQAWAESLTGSPSTRARKVSTIVSLLTFAHKHRYVEENLGLSLNRPKQTPKKVVPVDTSLIQDLVGAANGERDRLLIRVLYETGKSPEAVTKLRFKDLDQVSDGLKASLLEFQKDASPERLVFLSFRNQKLSARDARRMVQRAATEAGLDELGTAWLRKAHHWKDPKPVRAWNIRQAASGPFGIIYGLRDPRTNDLCYVGMTRLKLQERLRCHLSKANLKTRNRASGWLRGLLADGVRPVAEVLAVAKDRDELLYLERYHISQARSEGHPLVNSTHVWSLRKIQKRLRGDMSRWA